MELWDETVKVIKKFKNNYIFLIIEKNLQMFKQNELRKLLKFMSENE
jgi:hypothetical protein